MRDSKGYAAFKAQVDVLDVMWVDDETGFALCDDGGEEDSIYLLKDKVPFEFMKIAEKNIFVKLFNGLNKQLIEMIKKGEK